MRAGDFVGAKIYRKPTEDKRTKKDGTPRSPKKLGKIHFPVFTPGGTRVVGFMVRQSDIAGMIERPDRFVALDAIGVYEGAIAVDDVKDTYDAAAAKRLDINLDDCIIWVGMDVRTESGDVVGYCSDVEFKPRSGIVQAFYVTAGAASSILVGDTQVPPTMLRGYENGAMVVSDEVKSLGYSGGAAANMPTTTLTDADFTDGQIGVLTLLVKCGLASSNGEARKLVQGGGVSLNGEKVADFKQQLAKDFFNEECMIKKGKKTFHKAIFG